MPFCSTLFSQDKPKTDVEPDSQQFELPEILENSDRTFPLLTRPSIKDQK